MANYSLVVNSKFQPFSFDRYLQPYQIYGQNYKEIEEQYTDLSTKAGIWDKLANKQTDPKAYRMYKTYSDELKDKASKLAREGLNASSRQGLLNMRNRYSQDIVPIEKAYNQRSKLAEEQRKLRHEYIQSVRANLRAQLNNVSIKNEDGSITPLKPKGLN